MSNQNLKSFNYEIEKLLESVAKEEGFSDYKIERAAGGLKGDGYLGVITAVQICGKTKSGETKTLDLVVKSASTSDALREEAPISKVFEREIYMYNVVIPTFIKLQVENGLPVTLNFAKCYKACFIEKSEALVLQNLKTVKYSVWEKSIPMNEDHVKLVMTEYGRFHALTYALREQFPERFQKLIAPIDDVVDRFYEKGDYIKMHVEQCTKALNSLDPATDKQGIVKFRALIEEIPSFLKELSKFVDNYSVILHGDCWTNNMMFKYGDPNNAKKPTNVCFIDLQIARLGSPVLDLSYFFYTCASKTIINNWEQYLDVYYDSLSQCLKQFGVDSANVYPYSVFREHWKKYSRLGLIFSMLLIHIMLSDRNEATDLTEVVESGQSVTEAFDYNISDINEYNDRVRHIILHFVKNNLI